MADATEEETNKYIPNVNLKILQTSFKPEI